MRLAWRHGTLALIVCAFAAHPLAQTTVSSRTTARLHHNRLASSVTLTQDDGLSVLAAALDPRGGRTLDRDCSHLVHTIYNQAGFSYPYASSSDLYTGTDDFQRVARPQPGDLVVWNGHVGIVVNPAHGLFFSRLRSGPGVESYDDPYWKHRGPVRFYRYIRTRR